MYVIHELIRNQSYLTNIIIQHLFISPCKLFVDIFYLNFN